MILEQVLVALDQMAEVERRKYPAAYRLAEREVSMPTLRQTLLLLALFWVLALSTAIAVFS